MTPRSGTLAAAAVAAVVASVAVWTLGGSARDSSPGLDGASLFQAKGCASCHTGPDSGAVVSDLPNLSNAAAWAGQRVPGMSAEEYLTQSIREPMAVISPEFDPGRFGPTTVMPTLALSDAEVAALVDYLLTPS